MCSFCCGLSRHIDLFLFAVLTINLSVHVFSCFLQNHFICLISEIFTIPLEFPLYVVVVFQTTHSLCSVVVCSCVFHQAHSVSLCVLLFFSWVLVSSNRNKIVMCWLASLVKSNNTQQTTTT